MGGDAIHVEEIEYVLSARDGVSHPLAIVGVLEVADDRDDWLGEQVAQPLNLAGGVEHGGRAGQLREGLGVGGLVAAEGGGDVLGGLGYIQMPQQAVGVLDLGLQEQLLVW